MIDYGLGTRSCYVCALLFLLGMPSAGQIAQDHPELCGKPSGYVALPPNITAVSSNLESTLTFRLDGSVVSVTLDGVDEVQEVCPLSGRRLLVFGRLGDHSAHAVCLIDGASGTKLSEFWVRSPAVSPDQHWLALRQFYPAQADINVTEQYMLYDLTKDAEGNKLPGVDYRYVEALGRTMYPATPKHAPFESEGVRPDEVHTFEGGAFNWAADSKSVLFMDRTSAGLNLVLVRIGAADLTAYVHQLDSEICLSRISRADFTPVPGRGVPDVRIQFEASQCPPLFFREGDLKRAEVEIHKPKVRLRSVEDKGGR